MPDHIVFVTGKLAEPRLRAVLDGMASSPFSFDVVQIGVSVAAGRQLIGWADRQVAYRFAGAPKPRRPPRYGPEHARRERVGWYRHALAWAVGCALLLLACLLVGSWHRTTALTGTAAVWTVVLAIDFLISFSYTLWPRRERAT